jgi:hypothetical protein
MSGSLGHPWTLTGQQYSAVARPGRADHQAFLQRHASRGEGRDVPEALTTDTDGLRRPTPVVESRARRQGGGPQHVASATPREEFARA